MKKNLSRIGLYGLTGIVMVSAWQLSYSQQAPADTKKAGRGAQKKGYDGPMNKVLLKDWDPHSNLVVAEHHPLKGKFPVIDVHVHPAARNAQEVAQWVKTMDDTGVETAVLMTGAVGMQFDDLVDLYLKPYPTRFVLYCGMDTHSSSIDAPDFPQKVAAELDRCYRKGARGIGEITDKGRGFGVSSTVDGPPAPRDKRLFVDDHRLDLFWDKAAALKMPVNIHVADHPSAWQPPDEHQERTPNFQTYNQYGMDVPSHAEIIAKFQTMIDRHPKTTFIAVHFSNLGHDLAQLSKALDKFPNLNVDLSARAYEFGRQPFTAPAFFAKYKTRILFGSDQTVEPQMWRSWWRILETRDEFIKGPAGWPLYGLGLSDDILEAVYRGNAKRLYNWTKPSL